MVGTNAALFQNGTIRVDSYKSSNGAYTVGAALAHGYIGTNGGLTMTGGVTIKSNVYMKADQSTTINGAPDYGTRQTLVAPLTFPSITSYPAGSTSLGNVNASATIGSGTVNRDYYLTSLIINAGQTLTVNGPVTLYISGNCTLNGTFIVAGNKAANLTIKMMSSAGVNIQTASIYADIYAPQSPINITSTPNVYGRLIGSQLSVSNTTAIHVDESLPALPGTPQGPAGSNLASSITIAK